MPAVWRVRVSFLVIVCLLCLGFGVSGEEEKKNVTKEQEAGEHWGYLQRAAAGIKCEVCVAGLNWIHNQYTIAKKAKKAGDSLVYELAYKACGDNADDLTPAKNPKPALFNAGYTMIWEEPGLFAFVPEKRVTFQKKQATNTSDVPVNYACRRAIIEHDDIVNDALVEEQLSVKDLVKKICVDTAHVCPPHELDLAWHNIDPSVLPPAAHTAYNSKDIDLPDDSPEVASLAEMLKCSVCLSINSLVRSNIQQYPWYLEKGEGIIPVVVDQLCDVTPKDKHHEPDWKKGLMNEYAVVSDYRDPSTAELVFKDFALAATNRRLWGITPYRAVSKACKEVILDKKKELDLLWLARQGKKDLRKEEQTVALQHCVQQEKVCSEAQHRFFFHKRSDTKEEL